MANRSTTYLDQVFAAWRIDVKDLIAPAASIVNSRVRLLSLLRRLYETFKDPTTNDGKVQAIFVPIQFFLFRPNARLPATS